MNLRPKFKPGDYIYCTSGGIDIMKVININTYNYRLEQINKSSSGNIGSIFNLNCKAIDDIYQVINDEIKAELL